VGWQSLLDTKRSPCNDRAGTCPRPKAVKIGARRSRGFFKKKKKKTAARNHAPCNRDPTVRYGPRRACGRPLASREAICETVELKPGAARYACRSSDLRAATNRCPAMIGELRLNVRRVLVWRVDPARAKLPEWCRMCCEFASRDLNRARRVPRPWATTTRSGQAMSQAASRYGDTRACPNCRSCGGSSPANTMGLLSEAIAFRALKLFGMPAPYVSRDALCGRLGRTGECT